MAATPESARSSKAAGEPKTAGAIGDAAVKARTGKVWDAWFRILDRAGAQKMNHKEIAAWISAHHEPGPWWTQMITVAYERSRGLREPHQRPEGFQISVSRTIPVPVATIFGAWQSPRTRKLWLPEADIEIRRATPGKSMRITWADRKTSVEVGFYEKGEGKGQVSVQHGKLPDAKAAARMKVFWSEKLDRLREILTPSSRPSR